MSKGESMTQKEFNKIAGRLLLSKASPEEAKSFVVHAILLRSAVIDGIDRTDTWDEEWPELGYEPYADDDEDYDDLKAFQAATMKDCLAVAREAGEER